MTATQAQQQAKDAGFSVAGNRLALFTEGRDRLEALLALIAGAKRTLRLLYYMYRDDHAGRSVRAALLEALDRGVRVSLLVDGFGSDIPSSFFEPLDRAGATVCRFIPGYGRRYLLRNHQKLALADEERVIIGGFNLSDEYFGGDGPEQWRDLGLLLEGPAAARLAGYYDALAAWMQTPRGRIRTLRRALRRWSEPVGAVRWLLGGPTRRLSPWALAVKQDLRSARCLAIISAYFSPNPAMMRRIEAVGQRGDASVMTAAKSDNGTTIAAGRHCYHRLLKRGVHIFEYQPTKLHTKLLVIDDAVYLGSANFDMRSLFLNMELMLRIEDPAFADHMRRYIAGEHAQSVEITPEAHRKASTPLRRIRWALAYFAVAVLDYNVTRRLNFGLDR